MSLPISMGIKTPEEVKNDGYTGLDYNVYKKNPTWIKEAQDLGLTVNAWTVDKEEDMKDLLAQKVDYIFTMNQNYCIRFWRENKFL
ncbi:Glycerophosphoryl diester phosphodiesterase family protein [Arenibacter nanhaiticus]|uniref:Glycerophosphoryl diester phosphodiesterase family protein n=1 Tax=Arenibacter nanhaiticus TaxID=558155 RepID=A0A1M6C3V6_9FLAO|nr:glycerophosphodiester phosphodiesterase family protein [Arenibacter nanhaiticus]SHI55706.1 Glycerophosphoryl diester phosphodiesterase family protein [Arenibacter nanhaiticus]